jgi:phage shock protein C
MRPRGFGWGCGGWQPRNHRHHHSDGAPGWFSHIRLYRTTDEARIKGVCGGIAAYFGIPAVLVRILWLVGLFMNPPLAVISYFVLAWLLPPKPADLFASDEEEAFWKQVRTEPVGTVHELRHRFRLNEQRLRALEAYVTSPEFELNREFRGL